MKKGKSLASMAERVESKGRGGDDILVHMSRQELDQLTQMIGIEPTINPDTGNPELFSWIGNIIDAGAAHHARWDERQAESKRRKRERGMLEKYGVSGFGEGGRYGGLAPLSYQREQVAMPEEDYFTYGQKGGEHNFFKGGAYVDPHARRLRDAASGATAINPENRMDAPQQTQPRPTPMAPPPAIADILSQYDLSMYQ